MTTQSTASTPKTEAYLFVHFIGDEKTPLDEQIYFALSRDGVHWHDLRPAGKPALTWTGGEKGVRDPHIERDPRGGFHIVATDLSIHYRGGWGPNCGATVYHSSCLDVGGINAPSTSSISCMSIVLSFIFLLSSGLKR